jgi:methionyl-tRNA formyltransferase
LTIKLNYIDWNLQVRIIVMGSSTFALPALKKMIQNHEVVAVYTREAKPSGRGMQLNATPIEEYTRQNHIPIFTPKNFKNIDTIQEFKALNADIAVVAAYGLILPKAILDAPKLGCLNIHGSLLPHWRGAAPIHRAIMAGNKQTGVAIIQMSEELDEGDVFAMQSLPLTLNDTTGNIHDRLADMGADLLNDVINKINNNTINAVPQDHKNANYAHKITKEECVLDFKNRTAEEIILKINALNPFPSAFFNYQDQRFKIHQAEIVEKSDLNYGNAGRINSDFTIYCKKGTIRPIIIQKQNKQKQHINDFLHGFLGSGKNNQA